MPTLYSAISLVTAKVKLEWHVYIITLNFNNINAYFKLFLVALHASWIKKKYAEIFDCKFISNDKHSTEVNPFSTKTLRKIHFRMNKVSWKFK